jgi:hypothetical protein
MPPGHIPVPSPQSKTPSYATGTYWWTERVLDKRSSIILIVSVYLNWYNNVHMFPLFHLYISIKLKHGDI